MAEPPTIRGRETRERVLLAALRLFHQRGIDATSVDDVLAAAEAGKGQFYRYFESKQELVAAVVDYRIEHYLAPQQERLQRVQSIEELESYFAALVDGHRQSGLAGGCPVGSLALQLAGRDEAARRRLADALRDWESNLAAAFSRLIERDQLRTHAPPERLAAATLAAIQGAYLLASAYRDAEAMELALAQVIAGLRR